MASGLLLRPLQGVPALKESCSTNSNDDPDAPGDPSSAVIATLPTPPRIQALGLPLPGVQAPGLLPPGVQALGTIATGTLGSILHHPPRSPSSRPTVATAKSPGSCCHRYSCHSTNTIQASKM
eukprot:g40932.t1